MNPFAMMNFFFFFMLYAQQAPAQFFSPNRIAGAAATVYLENGDSLAGKLWLNNEVLVAPDIRVVTANGVTHRLHLLDVTAYSRNGVRFERKHTGNHIHPRSGFYFMKRLTPDVSAMHLYEHTERRQKGKSMQDIGYETIYYLQLPGEKNDRVFAATHRRLVPHLGKKMAALLTGCPSLQQKLHNKQPGYFYSRMNATAAQHRDVLLRIIGEYNQCATAAPRSGGVRR